MPSAVEPLASHHEHGHPNGNDRSTGIMLIIAGCLPFAVGGALAAIGGSEKAPVICPFRLATGLPCPLCGGTRAFSYAASGNSRFLSYNGFWVFVALAMIIMGLVITFTRFSHRTFWKSTGVMPVLVIAALLAGGWIWSLSNRGLIIS